MNKLTEWEHLALWTWLAASTVIGAIVGAIAASGTVSNPHPFEVMTMLIVALSFPTTIGVLFLGYFLTKPSNDENE